MPDHTTKIAVGRYDGATGHMSFELALDALKRGQRVRRAVWPEGVSLTLNGAGTPEAVFEGRFEAEAFKGVALEGLLGSNILAEDWVEAI
jgi:hypothetical protein